MGSVRNILKILRSRATLEGAGVHLKRAFGYPHVPQLDPFLLLDDFHSDDPREYLKGFPWHPHRGIETITYVLHGSVEHGDSLGNRGTISSGDVQWMTAGSGIIHQEMPTGREDGLLWGFQLWANLPASHKMMHPRYRDVTHDQIPLVTLDGGARVRIICGRVGGASGPVQDIVTDPEVLDVTLPPRSNWTHPVQKGYTAFAYVIEGRGTFEPEQDPYGYEVEGASYFDLRRDHAVEPESVVIWDDGDELAVTTDGEPVRFLLVSGKPIGEPVAWHGPIVMNTREELRVAFEEYQRGTFLKHGGAQPPGVGT
jgi:redox-sensitive bicupin YhaK (pirin superfamily)